MTKVGNIFSLFFSTENGRVEIDEMQLDEKGVIGDKHYNKDNSRSVLLTSLDSYVLTEKHNIKVTRGALGENLLMSYNPYGLTAGSRLKIGNVVLEVSQHCTLCKNLTNIDAKLPQLLKNDRGIFSKVIESGSIKKGDDVYLLG